MGMKVLYPCCKDAMMTQSPFPVMGGTWLRQMFLSGMILGIAVEPVVWAS